MKPLFGIDAELPKEKTIVFLGDSITDEGTYIAYLDAYFRLHAPESRIKLINLGISSETTSGLSEPAHPFPRPCVFDRLDRALAETRPDWVVVCYGMNDGIYYPFGEDRFAAYRDGYSRVLRAVRAAGAKAIAMTPPPFDGASLDRAAERLLPEGEAEYSYETPYADYTEVMKRYAEWVLSLGGTEADAVVNIYEPMRAHIEESRAADPTYVSGDGIHPNGLGHWVMARTLLKTLFNVTLERVPAYVTDPEGVSAVYPLVWERHRLVSAAWREHVGHTNPNKAENALPLPEAYARAELLEARIVAAIEASPNERLQLSESVWEGYRRLDFMLNGREGLVVFPKEPAAGSPWVWRAEFFGAFDYADRAMLERGWALAYYRLSDMYGAPGAVRLMRGFQAHVVETFGLAAQTVLFGFSRGGLYSFNYAAAHPDQVALLYLDAPALDMRLWPGGAEFRGTEESERFFAIYGLTPERLESARISPLDHPEPVASAGIPILIVTGDQDEAVPMELHALKLAERYRALGGELELIVKPGGRHHPHSLSDPTPIVTFILDRV